MKFHRSEGIYGQIPREWIMRNLPVCPFCGESARWLIGCQYRPWARYYFKCSECAATISVPAAKVGIVKGLIGSAMRAAAPKMVRLESVGRSGASVQGGVDFSLEELARLADQEC